MYFKIYQKVLGERLLHTTTSSRDIALEIIRFLNECGDYAGMRFKRAGE
jgi:hypothetical protein